MLYPPDSGIYSSVTLRVTKEEAVARRVILADDLDGSEATQTLNYTVDGQEYEIDLSEENAEKLRTTLAPRLPTSMQVVKSIESSRTKLRR